jgi:hypothetical protein
MNYGLSSQHKIFNLILFFHWCYRSLDTALGVDHLNLYAIPIFVFVFVTSLPLQRIKAAL